MNCQEYPGSSTRYLGSSPSSPPYHQRSNHLPRLAEATAGPEDIVLVLVAAPVLIGDGSSASAVLCDGGGGIDISGKKDECSLEDPRVILSRVIHDESNILIIEDSDRFPRNRYRIFLSFHIDGEFVPEISALI